MEDKYHFTSHNEFTTKADDLHIVIQDAVNRIRTKNALKPVSITRNLNLDDLALESCVNKNLIKSHFESDHSIHEELVLISTLYKFDKIESNIDYLHSYIQITEPKSARVRNQAFKLYKTLLDFYEQWLPLFKKNNLDITALTQKYEDIVNNAPPEFTIHVPKQIKALPKVPKQIKALPKKIRALPKDKLKSLKLRRNLPDTPTAKAMLIAFLEELQNTSNPKDFHTNSRSALNHALADACGIKFSRLKLVVKESPELIVLIENALEQHYYQTLLNKACIFPVFSAQFKDNAELIQEYHRCKHHVRFMIRTLQAANKPIDAMQTLLHEIDSSFATALDKLEPKNFIQTLELSICFEPNPYNKITSPKKYKLFEELTIKSKKLYDAAISLFSNEKKNPTNTPINLTTVYEAANLALSGDSTYLNTQIAAVHKLIRFLDQQRRIDYLIHHLNMIKQNPSIFIDKYGYYIDLHRLLSLAKMSPRKYDNITLSFDELFMQMDEVQGVLLDIRNSTNR